MHEPVKVVVLGTGQMGTGIAQLLRHKAGIELVGVYGRRAVRAGMDMSQAQGVGQPLGLAMSHDLPGLLRSTRPHVAIQATCSRVVQVMDDITTLLNHGVNVISIAEEMAYPAYHAPDLAATLHALALQQQVTVLGTGMNPGFVLDTLIIALTGVCANVESIEAERINDLSPYGPSVLRSQGVGLPPAAFAQGVADGSVVGHHGFPESMSLIARALGWQLERLEQHREPIIAQVQRRTPFVTVDPGHTAGCLHTAVAYMQDRPVLTLRHPQQVQPHLEGVTTRDRIDIYGEPEVHMVICPEIPGGVATAALAVNMIPAVLNAPPGLTSMAELPVPAAIMGDIRSLLHSKKGREPYA